MILEDWHTHNQLCHHATGSIEDYIKKAIGIGIATIGICDHFPYEFLKNIERLPFKEYAMNLSEIELYISTVEALKEKYKNKLNIRIGFEIDFFENQESALNSHLNKIKDRLDYILGSIHILDFHDGRGAWGFDDTKFRDDYKYYGANKVYMEYYKTQQKMLNSKEFDFDVVSHFDLPKKFNDVPNNKDMVYNEVMKSLELIKKKGLTIEINTSGFRKDVKEQYPSQEIIQKMYELDVPIVLGSDAHDPGEIGFRFKEMIKDLNRIGYKQIAHYHKRKLLLKYD